MLWPPRAVPARATRLYGCAIAVSSTCARPLFGSCTRCVSVVLPCLARVTLFGRVYMTHGLHAYFSYVSDTWLTTSDDGFHLVPWIQGALSAYAPTIRRHSRVVGAGVLFHVVIAPRLLFHILIHSPFDPLRTTASVRRAPLFSCPSVCVLRRHARLFTRQVAKCINGVHIQSGKSMVKSNECVSATFFHVTRALATAFLRIPLLFEPPLDPIPSHSQSWPRPVPSSPITPL
jgi:hypothetical protein